MKNVLLIDTHNLLHRARFGFGEGPHKIYFNFFRMLKGEMNRHNPDIVYIVDEGRPEKSKELLPDYKGNRVKLDDPQFWREKDEVFEAIKEQTGLVYIKHPRRECDDVIGYLADCVHKNDNVTIVSTDSDFIQLITENVKLWHPKKKSYVDKWYCDYVTWKALRGDSTDNVPGVSGIGPKRADVLAADMNVLKEFLDKDSERKKQFNVAYDVIKLKNINENDLIVRQSNFDEKKFYEGFSQRQCKSIIGNAWPKWVTQFAKSGGIHDIQPQRDIKSAAD